MGQKKLTTRNVGYVVEKLFTQLVDETNAGDGNTPIREKFKTAMEEMVKSRQAGAVVREKLNGMLDELVSDDVFGTEGQLDPRGDQRNTFE